MHYGKIEPTTRRPWWRWLVYGLFIVGLMVSAFAGYIFYEEVR